MRIAALFFCVAACGGGQQPTTTGDVHLDKPDAAAVALPNKPAQPLGIPHDAPFVASFDATAFARIIPLREEIARELDVDASTLVAQAGALGLDTKRPVTMALAPLDANEMRVVSELRARFNDPNVMPTDDDIKHILAAGDSPLVIRILVPTTNAEKLEALIGKFLHGEGFKKNASGYSKRESFIAIDDDGLSVAVDVLVAHEKADRKALQAFATTAHDPPPLLGEHVMRATWSPSAIAAIGYLTGLVRAAGAVSGESVDPSQRVRIMRAGMTEAAANFTVATFDRIDVEAKLGPFEFVGRAKPSAAFVMPGADAFAQSTGVAYPSVAVAQASRAFMKGWPFPGGNVKSTIETIRDGGGGAVFAGLPHVLAMIPAVESRRSREAPAFDLARFDRVATAFDQSSDTVFISVMPAGTKRADAECAFAPKTPCDPKTKLKLNTVVKAGDLSAKLYELGTADKRFVVVSSDSDSAKLDAPTLMQAGGMRVDMDTSLLARFLDPNTLPTKASGEITNESGTLVFRAK